MIRLASEADIPRLVEMGLRFRRESEYVDVLAENAGKMEELARQLAKNGCLVVSERAGRVVGMLGYVIFPHFLSGELVSGEVFWWVEPEERGEGLKLLRAAEECSRRNGAKFMQMIAPNDRVGAFYERLGYRRVETSFQRPL
jgi:RimJ/RimL family protein N-acetyltransferase